MKFLGWFIQLLIKIFGGPDKDYSKMPALSYGDKNASVKTLQERLKELGYFYGETGGNFLDKTRDAVKAFQKANSLTPDGVVGKYTWKKLEKNKEVFHDFWGAPWMKFFFDNIWKDEFKHDKFWSSFWKYSGENYKTVVGSSYAWCMNGVNAALGVFGFKTTMSPMAVSLKKYGQLAGGYWFGAPCHVEHASGGNHVFFFLFWYDKAKNQAACAGFNQSNTSNITIYDFDKEKLTPPRWPAGHPPGIEITRAEFEKAYPQYAKYTMSGSTR